MRVCGFYGHNELNSCGTKDFQSLFYYASAAPVFSLFCFKQKRYIEFIAALAYAILCFALIVPERHTWVRNALNVFIYTCFVIVLQSLRERVSSMALFVEQTGQARAFASADANALDT